MKIPNAEVVIQENSVRLVVEEISSLRSVCIGMLVKAGTKNEPINKMGISHFIEHMNFKGTDKRSAMQIATELDCVGGKLNAYTSKEHTVYYASVQDKYFNVAADILSDMYLNSVYDEKEMALEKKVVLEEIKMYEDSPDDQIHDIFASTVLKGHSLGYSTLGTVDSVNSISREDIFDYRKQLYNPDNIIISVAGNINKEKVQSTFLESFGKTNGISNLTKEIVPETKQSVVLKKKQTEQAHIMMGTIGPSQKDDNRYIFAVLDNILGGSMSSRLFQEVREKRALAYSIYSYNQHFSDTGLFGVYAGSSKENIKEIIDIVKNEIISIKDKGLTEQELSRAKEFIKGSMVLGLESSSSRMNYLAKTLLYQGRVVLVDEVFAKIDCINNEQIIKAANEYLDISKMSLVVIADLDELPEIELK